MNADTLPCRPTDTELAAARCAFTEALHRTALHLARLRDQAERAAALIGIEADEVREDIDATRASVLNLQAETAGYLAATQVEIEYRKLRGAWRGDSHAPH